MASRGNAGRHVHDPGGMRSGRDRDRDRIGAKERFAAAERRKRLRGGRESDPDAVMRHGLQGVVGRCAEMIAAVRSSRTDPEALRPFDGLRHGAIGDHGAHSIAAVDACCPRHSRGHHDLRPRFDQAFRKTFDIGGYSGHSVRIDTPQIGSHETFGHDLGIRRRQSFVDKDGRRKLRQIIGAVFLRGIEHRRLFRHDGELARDRASETARPIYFRQRTTLTPAPLRMVRSWSW